MGYLNQLIRQRLPGLYWEHIDRECMQVYELFRSPGPKSLIRTGDGELDILRNRDPESLALGLSEAIKHADCLGLPNDYKPPPISKWKSALIRVLDEDYGVDAGRNMQVSSVLFRHVPELIGQLAAGRRVLWITHQAAVVVKNLRDPAFRDYYNLHDIIDNYWINAVQGTYSSPLPKDVSAKWAEADIRQQLTRVPDFDLAFVGAGAVAKPICHHIKTDLGASAIDLGCNITAMRGVVDRGYLRPGAKFDCLVWDPARV